MVEVAWRVEIGDQFEPEFDELPEAVQDEILAQAQLLEKFGLSPHFSHLIVARGWRWLWIQGARGAPACGSAPANVLYGTLRRPTERNAVDAARSAAAVDWV